MAIFYTGTLWLVIQAFGDSAVQGVIAKDPAAFFFTAMGMYVGQWGVSAMFVLIVSSIFAGQLAFHNAINRYSFALSRDGILPAFFNRTNRMGAPWLAGLVQSVVAIAVVIAFGVAGLDPLTQLVILVNSPGVYGIITLQLLASISVVIFIMRNRELERRWYVLPAAIVSLVAMAVLLAVLVITIDYLTAAGPAINAVILAVVPVVLIAGSGYALFLRARKPEVFARIGGADPESVVNEMAEAGMTREAAADLVLLGGVVVTMVPTPTTGPEAEGLAIVSGEVVALGSRSVLQSYIGEGTRVIELPDAAILPGFVDSHIHPVFGIDMTRGATSAGAARSPTSRRRCGQRRPGLADGEWLLGWGLDPNVFGEEPVSNDGPERGRGRAPGVHPILRRPCRTRILGGARACPCHGDRRVHRRVTCRHRRGRAARPATSLSSRPCTWWRRFCHRWASITAPRRSTRCSSSMARAGFTSGQVQDLAPDAIELLQTIEATRDLPIRLRMSPWYVPGAPLEEVSRLAGLQGVHGRRWIVEGVKLMIDGTIDNGTAWLHEPDCLGESTASLWLDPEQYRDAVAELDRRGIPTTTHAIGDAGHRLRRARDRRIGRATRRRTGSSTSRR